MVAMAVAAAVQAAAPVLEMPPPPPPAPPLALPPAPPPAPPRLAAPSVALPAAAEAAAATAATPGAAGAAGVGTDMIPGPSAFGSVASGGSSVISDGIVDIDAATKTINDWGGSRRLQDGTTFIATTGTVETATEAAAAAAAAPVTPEPVIEKLPPGAGQSRFRGNVKVGQCRLTVSKSVLKAPVVSALETKM